jgi:transposase-like protein
MRSGSIYRFSLSYRDVKKTLLKRVIEVSRESIRQWCGTFGPDYANRLRRPRPGDKL